MTLHQLFNDAIQWGEPRLAYTIYWATHHGISLNQNFETLKNAQIDFQAVRDLVESDPLGISHIKLYTCRDGDDFHLVLAESEADAKGEILTRFGKVPKQMHDVSYGMDKILWDDQQNKTIWIRGIKDSSFEFPVYVGLIEKDD